MGGRYVLVHRLGAGAGGEVWRATDRVVGGDVAVKRLARGVGDNPSQRRREAAALRLLRLPGVVALRDEVVEDGVTFLVLDLVAGRPFPGVPLPAPWAEVRERTRALLETLARVHALGVFHGDLKPENVLVDGGGTPRLLDFDLSAGPGVAARAAERGFIAGTLAYLAPEQLSGEPADTRSDLYALGVMLHHTLSGCAPHAAETFPELVMLRTGTDAPALARVVPGVPAEAAALVDALLARRPEDRPRDGAAALRILSAEPEDAAERRIAAALAALPPAEGAPRGLFHGPDVALHLREDAAAELVRRAGADRGEQALEAAAWLRAGFVRWDGDRLRVERAALDLLAAGLPVRPGSRTDGQPPPAAARAFALLAAGEAAALVDEACALAADAADDGDVAHAAAVVRVALDAARRAALAGAEERLLGRLIHLAVLDGTPGPMGEALYEIERRAGESEGLQRLETLARAFVHAPTADARLAAAAIRGLPPFEEEHLEWPRMACLVFSARRLGREASEDALREVAAAWADRPSPLLRAALLKWRGYHLYLHGSFEEAATLLGAAAEAAPTRRGRHTAEYDAAVACRGAGRFEEADERERRILEDLGGRRAPYLECMLAIGRREAEYQQGRSLAPLPGLEEAARELAGPIGLGALRLAEAASAWRDGDGGTARRGAEEAAAGLREGMASGGGWEAAALAHLCGARGGAFEPTAILAATAAGGPAMIRLQAVALLALAGTPPPAAWRDLLPEALRVVGGGGRARRREVLSLEECEGALDGTWRPPLPGVVERA